MRLLSQITANHKPAILILHLVQCANLCLFTCSSESMFVSDVGVCVWQGWGIMDHRKANSLIRSFRLCWWFHFLVSLSTWWSANQWNQLVESSIGVKTYRQLHPPPPLKWPLKMNKNLQYSDVKVSLKSAGKIGKCFISLKAKRVIALTSQ